MRVDTRWVQSNTSDLVPVQVNSRTSSGTENDQQTRKLSVQSQALTTAPQISPTSGVLFPPQRVEPLDMARSQISTTNRQRAGYVQPATNDEIQPTASYMQNQPIKRVKHPTERSSIMVFLQRLLRLCLSLFISLPFVLIISIFVPICWLIRSMVRLTCRFQCTVTPCTCSYLSATDLFWFYQNRIIRDRDKSEETTKIDQSSLSPTAAAVFFLEGAINENSLKKILLNRLVSCSSRRGSNAGKKIFPRFSQIVVSRYAGAMWIDYSLFSIDEHVKEIPEEIQSDSDLQVYLSALTSAELTLTRPLWQLHYKNRVAGRSPESILIFLYHPALSDGVSLIRILLKHVVDNRTTQLDIKPRFAANHSEAFFDYIRAYFYGHRLLLSKLIFNSLPENFFKRNSQTQKGEHQVLNNDLQQSPNIQKKSYRRTVVWSDPFSLTQVNRIKLVTRTRMNDILSTLIISSIKLYMERNGINHPPNMHCIMPCDLRSNSGIIIMGNKLSHLCVEIPMNIEGNIPVLWSFNENMKQIKENGDHATMYLFTKITYLLFPSFLANKIIGRLYNSASLWLTTLAAGTSTALATMSICNRDVRSMVCLSPSVGTATINFCVTSYADEIRLCVSADSNIVKDANFFTECFIKQLRIVYDLLAHRRIPGEIRRIIRPPRMQPSKKSISSISEMSEDLTIEEIQAKMTSLQQELLSLKSQFENVDMDDPSSQNQRFIITSKLEELRREFRELLIKLQERQCELSGMIPSDEEDEMDPQVRVRLRSSSVASRISLRSNDQRLLSAKMYHLDKEDGSDVAAAIFRAVPSASKTSLATQNFVNNNQTTGLRRAQSVGAWENSQSDLQQSRSVDRSRPVTPSQPLTTTTHTTILQLETTTDH